ncbi:MAG TPA: hypothetical protein VFQ68_08610 [Streptosporangiaceae bacterium]|nr:hypothetical protein [Streptosporangiaceae bacterium]
MPGPFFDAAERARLSDLLDELGPDAPTLLMKSTSPEAARSWPMAIAPSGPLPPGWVASAEILMPTMNSAPTHLRISLRTARAKRARLSTLPPWESSWTFWHGDQNWSKRSVTPHVARS